MSRHRTPTDLLVSAGTFTKNPGRAAARFGEPVPIAPIGDPPATLNAAQAACFRELVAASHAGVLSSADAFVIEIASILLEELRRNPAGISAAKISRLEGILARCGMTPSDRSRVVAQPSSPHGRPGASPMRHNYFS